MPGINLETNGFVPLGFWNDWFSVKANYSEYLMNDDRIVEGVKMHRKSLHLRFETSDKFSFNGSGFPIPSKGDRITSAINLFILFNVFLSSELINMT